VWLKWQSTCFASTKPQVQTPIPPKKVNKNKKVKKEYVNQVIYAYSPSNFGKLRH
jgi:hypothetical protein